MIFLKEPIAGQVKTRLGQEIGMDKACDVYIEFIKQISTTLVFGEHSTHVYYTGHTSAPILRELFHNSVEFHIQCEGDLGQRMHQAFTECFDKGFEKVVVIGGDSPDIPPQFISDTFGYLSDNDVVIGPALDGGYYLLGLKKPDEFLFENMEWSTADVFGITLGRIMVQKLKYHLLPPWLDVDTPEDYRMYLEKLTHHDLT